jgi:hypothetical protein
MAGFICQAQINQETRVYNVEEDVAGIICQAQLTQETRVYNVKGDVTCIICQTLPQGWCREGDAEV